MMRISSACNSSKFRSISLVLVKLMSIFAKIPRFALWISPFRKYYYLNVSLFQ